MTVAILDIDGTLVDTNYHHALAWFRALCEFGLVLPIWRIHRHIGMGGDQMVGALCGDEVEREHGDAVRGAEGDRYGELIGEVRTMSGSRELIVALKEVAVAVAVAIAPPPRTCSLPWCYPANNGGMRRRVVTDRTA